jgi:hypothetical protein
MSAREWPDSSLDAAASSSKADAIRASPPKKTETPKVVRRALRQ